jgi:superfamily I DNA/RNA helicase
VLVLWMEFNPDGSLKIEGKQKQDLELFQEESPYQTVLALVQELPFPIGRKFLAEVLQGHDTAKIKKCRMQFCENYGALDLYDVQDIYNLIDELLFDGFLEITKTRASKYYPVVMLTTKGKQELTHPSKLSKEYTSSKHALFEASEITEDDRTLFAAFGQFLETFNDEQKKAIISPAEKILCVAGAGSGKTTVLTKRIEYLVKLRGVDPKKILAITFTRKARQEMISRLSNSDVAIETFNSFCEKQLQRHQDVFYGKSITVMDFKWRMRLVTESLNALGYTPQQAVSKYFTSKRGKDDRTLYFNLVYDIFSLIDHYKNNEEPISVFKETIVQSSNSKDRPVALFVYNIIEQIQERKEKYGLRDYTDQIVHAIKLFEQHADLTPQYEHILVDEYQDVNDIQVKLLDTLNAPSVFVVGDPRQSIYGWRGSKIKNIMTFPEKYENATIIQLTKNYRSQEAVIKTANEIIKPMQLPDLEHAGQHDKEQPVLIHHKNEEKEAMFVAQSILSQQIPRNEIFVLARTNKHIDTITQTFDQFGIEYLTRTTEERQESLEPKEHQVTVSTVHAIKGLEADIVYLVGVNIKMYPCLVSDHPVQDLAKLDFEYDKQEEELRLLYVALTRARKHLYVNYSGRLSKYISDKNLFKIVDTVTSSTSSDTMSRLKEWRMDMSRAEHILPFMVLPDRVLLQLTQQMPSSVTELHDISGMGPTKIRKYGEELLDILNGF